MRRARTKTLTLEQALAVCDVPAFPSSSTKRRRFGGLHLPRRCAVDSFQDFSLGLPQPRRWYVAMVVVPTPAAQLTLIVAPPYSDRSRVELAGMDDERYKALPSVDLRVWARRAGPPPASAKAPPRVSQRALKEQAQRKAAYAESRKAAATAIAKQLAAAAASKANPDSTALPVPSAGQKAPPPTSSSFTAPAHTARPAPSPMPPRGAYPATGTAGMYPPRGHPRPPYRPYQASTATTTAVSGAAWSSANARAATVPSGAQSNWAPQPAAAPRPAGHAASSTVPAGRYGASTSSFGPPTWQASNQGARAGAPPGDGGRTPGPRPGAGAADRPRPYAPAVPSTRGGETDQQRRERLELEQQEERLMAQLRQIQQRKANMTGAPPRVTGPPPAAPGGRAPYVPNTPRSRSSAAATSGAPYNPGPSPLARPPQPFAPPSAPTPYRPNPVYASAMPYVGGSSTSGIGSGAGQPPRSAGPTAVSTPYRPGSSGSVAPAPYTPPAPSSGRRPPQPASKGSACTNWAPNQPGKWRGRAQTTGHKLYETNRRVFGHSGFRPHQLEICQVGWIADG